MSQKTIYRVQIIFKRCIRGSYIFICIIFIYIIPSCLGFSSGIVNIRVFWKYVSTVNTAVFQDKLDNFTIINPYFQVYPPPHEIAEQFASMGLQCPHFLLSISDPKHVPPHVVASELLLVVHNLQNTINTLVKEREEMKTVSIVSEDDCTGNCWTPIPDINCTSVQTEKFQQFPETQLVPIQRSLKSPILQNQFCRILRMAELKKQINQ